MIVASLIAQMLEDANFACYFAFSSALDVPEPIVVYEGGSFEREVRGVDEERGHITVRVLVVRDVAADAETDALMCEKAIGRADWERHSEKSGWRICGVDTTAPVFVERDSSGRYVWGFDVICTVVRQK